MKRRFIPDQKQAFKWLSLWGGQPFSVHNSVLFCKIEFLLQNLVALPPGQFQVSFNSGIVVKIIHFYGHYLVRSVAVGKRIAGNIDARIRGPTMAFQRGYVAIAAY